jgi:hypothetical protein
MLELFYYMNVTILFLFNLNCNKITRKNVYLEKVAWRSMESAAPAKGSDFSIETSPGSGSTRTISVRLVL